MSTQTIHELPKLSSFKVSEPVTVICSHQAAPAFVIPQKVIWKNREYSVKKLGLHHIFREGKTLFHVFSVTTETLFMRLVLNTDTLFWRLEEIWDAGTSF